MKYSNTSTLKITPIVVASIVLLTGILLNPALAVVPIGLAGVSAGSG